MSTIVTYRRYFAEEIAAVSNVKTAGIIDALVVSRASVISRPVHGSSAVNRIGAAPV